VLGVSSFPFLIDDDDGDDDDDKEEEETSNANWRFVVDLSSTEERFLPRAAMPRVMDDDGRVARVEENIFAYIFCEELLLEVVKN